MRSDKSQSTSAEREFVAAGDTDSSGKVRELPMVTSKPQPPVPLSEFTRVESLIFDTGSE